MKRYKHIRTDMVVILDEREDIYRIVDKTYSFLTIPVCLVENSNDWKLIPEREWEVIAFKSSKPEFKVDYSPEYLQSIGASITKLKRISDGMEFGIGDLISWDDINGTTYHDSCTGLKYICIDKFVYENSTEDMIINYKYSLNSILARNPKRFDETPDFEILKFKDIHNEYFKKENGKFTINLQYEYTVENLLGIAKISSVKRIRDNEVFSIGDITNFGTITGFSFDNKIPEPVRMEVKFKGFRPQPDKNIEITTVQYLTNVTKLKPIFTTEDDVDIYQGDECWYALPRNSFEGKYTLKRRKCNGKAVNGKYFYHKENAEKYIFTNTDAFYVVDRINWVALKSTDLEDFKNVATMPKFNTKEEAEKYIAENEPKYSANDIKKFINTHVSEVFADVLYAKFLETTKK
jgi:hypothetical protein